MKKKSSNFVAEKSATKNNSIKLVSSTKGKLVLGGKGKIIKPEIHANLQTS